MSWPLWYLLALIWASFLVKIMLKWKMKVEWILISGLCLTLIGWGVKYVLETEHADDCLEKIVYVYKRHSLVRETVCSWGLALSLSGCFWVNGRIIF